MTKKTKVKGTGTSSDDLKKRLEKLDKKVKQLEKGKPKNE